MSTMRRNGCRQELIKLIFYLFMSRYYSQLDTPEKLGFFGVKVYGPRTPCSFHFSFLHYLQIWSRISGRVSVAPSAGRKWRVVIIIPLSFGLRSTTWNYKARIQSLGNSNYAESTAHKLLDRINTHRIDNFQNFCQFHRKAMWKQHESAQVDNTCQSPHNAYAPYTSKKGYSQFVTNLALLRLSLWQPSQRAKTILFAYWQQCVNVRRWVTSITIWRLNYSSVYLESCSALSSDDLKNLNPDSRHLLECPKC